MATIISVHSFRGGTGKSNTTANLAVVYARRGMRVGVIDTDFFRDLRSRAAELRGVIRDAGPE